MNDYNACFKLGGLIYVQQPADICKGMWHIAAYTEDGRLVYSVMSNARWSPALDKEMRKALQ